MMKNGKIRGDIVKESLMDYDNLAKTLKENTQSTVKELLKETVLEQYAKILTEEEDKDYDVEEVDDTESTPTNDGEEAADESGNDEAAEGMDAEGEEQPTEGDDAEGVEEEGSEEEFDAPEGEIEDNGEEMPEGNEEEWAEFDKYKVNDGQYDFSNAEDEDIVKVYKLLKGDDKVSVKTSNDKVTISDNETGSEYIITLGGDDEPKAEEEPQDDIDTDFSNEYDDMNESTIYEVALNEYNSNVGYTDNYQKKDVMTTDGVAEPGKNVNDWDKGVPHDTKKPWSGKKGNAKENQPFTAEKGKTVEEEETIEESAGECGAKMGAKGRMMGTKTHKPKSGKIGAPYGQHHTSVAGEYKGNPSPDEGVNEAIKRKANKIFKENAELKNALVQFKNMLKEAAVTNVNLGNIVKLVMENATTLDEKKEIIARFGNEARTVEDSKKLYESIASDLKKKTQMNITEDVQTTVQGNAQINETQIYRSNDLLASLDLMHRICK